ncbi:MAG TPA: hypothetical protein VF003_04445 [Pseudonocardiaceae bacterium]
MAAEPTFVIAGPVWPDVQHLTACDVTGGKDLVVRSRKDYQMGEAADVMHRKIGAFNAHDAKETPRYSVRIGRKSLPEQACIAPRGG